MGSIIGGESGADMIQASGQASWADLVWIETSKYMGGNILPPALVLTLMWSDAVTFLLALAGSCTVVYASLHCEARTLPTIISLG